MIAIVDYGLGNLRSIQNMLRKAGVESFITAEPAKLAGSKKLILPGVGHFRYGMQCLKERGLIDVLNDRVQDAKVPVLGICLGAQLLGRRSAEGPADGLGWIAMDVVPFDRDKLGPADRVPHMGWTDTKPGGHALFAGQRDPRFYYVHSYHFQCDSPGAVIATAEHGYRFPAAVASGNVMGVQFHPEKSHAFGMKLLKTFAAMDADR